MSTPSTPGTPDRPTTPPDPPTTVTDPPRSRWRQLRPRSRGTTAGAALLALLIVGAVAFALADGPDRGDRGGPVRVLDEDSVGVTDLGGLAELDGPGGPADRRDGPERIGGGRGGAPDRGLGDDTLLAGTVVSTADGSIVLTPDGGAQRTIRTDDRTRVRGSGNAAPGDLQAGERVVVRVSGTGDSATAVSITAPQARVTGTVTALAGNTATVTAIDGLVVTVDVTALSQRPAVGDLVVLSGVAANGTTITADGVRILPKAS